MKRCAWVNPENPLMVEYHDREWGVPVHDDRKHFEFLVLEGAQAGLSWSTILKRREGYRSAFSDFDPEKVAGYSVQRIEEMLLNASIIRNRQKIEAAVRNARAFLILQDEFGSFDSYCWRFVEGRPIVNHRNSAKEVPATSRRVRRLQQRSQEARLQLCRLDHHLRPHAGRRHGQRPSHRLLPLR